MEEGLEIILSLLYLQNSLYSSNSEDERMEEELEIIPEPLNITGQPPTLILRMRGWRGRGWRSY